ncbi:hypothetical protein [Qipengyuania sp. JC766]|uniref:hypothetical protein n=1 Tax=Qipengyuania sp. JC766 TaxID=3232139 RepID=UPI003458BE43
MTRRKDPTEIRTPVSRDDLPAFDNVPVKYRHDGWTPARQKAFIGALADTGSVSRAARFVNMSPEGAYYLRRRPGAESFRRAWEAALDLGVQQLKDIAYERAIDGQLRPVFVGGKLKGFRRIRNDRLLMFCLRMNAKDERGQRLSASYFRSDADRLHGGSGSSSSSVAIGQQGISYTTQALTRAEKDDMNAAMVEHFDPVDMSLAEIEPMQAQLVEIARRKRAEEDGPAEHRTDPAFMLSRNEEFRPIGELESLHEVEEELEHFNEDEDHWRDLE